MKRKILVVTRRMLLDLYKEGLMAYQKYDKNVTIEFFELDNPKSKLSIVDKLQYKFDINSFREKYYDSKRNELINKIQQYDEILFINLFSDKEYFIKGNLKDLLQIKKTKIFFVDSIKLYKDFEHWGIFNGIYSFEYSDVEYCKELYGIDVKYVPIGTSYFIFDVLSKQSKYDLCFVGLANEVRLEYLEKICKYCYENNKTIFIAGHFWHDNNWLNYQLGKLKFSRKYPMIAKYVENHWVRPSDLAKLYCDSKICLNINAPQHTGVNQRTFDIMLCRGLMICSKVDVTGLDLMPERDFIMCSDSQDMIDKVDYFLKNEEERNLIIDRAYDITTREYLFNNTLKKIFE